MCWLVEIVGSVCEFVMFVGICSVHLLSTKTKLFHRIRYYLNAKHILP